MPTDNSSAGIPRTSDFLIPILILEQLAKSEQPMSVAGLGNCLGLERTEIRLHLDELTSQGFVQKVGSPETFDLGPRATKLTYRILSSQRPSTI